MASAFPPTPTTETVVILNQTIINDTYLSPLNQFFQILPSLLIYLFVLLGMAWVLFRYLKKLMKERHEVKIRCTRLVYAVGKMGKIRPTYLELEEVVVVPKSQLLELEKLAREAEKSLA